MVVLTVCVTGLAPVLVKVNVQTPDDAGLVIATAIFTLPLVSLRLVILILLVCETGTWLVVWSLLTPGVFCTVLPLAEGGVVWLFVPVVFDWLFALVLELDFWVDVLVVGVCRVLAYSRAAPASSTTVIAVAIIIFLIRAFLGGDFFIDRMFLSRFVVLLVYHAYAISSTINWGIKNHSWDRIHR